MLLLHRSWKICARTAKLRGHAAVQAPFFNEKTQPVFWILWRVRLVCSLGETEEINAGRKIIGSTNYSGNALNFSLFFPCCLCDNEIKNSAQFSLLISFQNSLLKQMVLSYSNESQRASVFWVISLVFDSSSIWVTSLLFDSNNIWESSFLFDSVNFWVSSILFNSIKFWVSSILLDSTNI